MPHYQGLFGRCVHGGEHRCHLVVERGGRGIRRPDPAGSAARGGGRVASSCGHDVVPRGSVEPQASNEQDVHDQFPSPVRSDHVRHRAGRSSFRRGRLGHGHHARAGSGRSASGLSRGHLVCSCADRSQPHRPGAARPGDPADPPRDDSRRTRRATGRYRAGRAPVRRRSCGRPASPSSQPGGPTAGTGSGAGRGCLRSSSPRPKHLAWSWRCSTASRRPPTSTTSSALPWARSSGPCPRASAGRRPRCENTRRPRRTGTRPVRIPPPPAHSSLLSRPDAACWSRIGARPASEWEAEVDPWAVVVRHGRWYLLCHSHHADAIRTYRVDRVRAVQQTALGFELPGGLDPVATVEENLGSGWEFPTRVVFDAPLAAVAPWVGSPMGRLEPGRRAACSSEVRAIRRCTRRSGWRPCRSTFRVDDGPELRAAVAKLASRFAAALDDHPVAV